MVQNKKLSKQKETRALAIGNYVMTESNMSVLFGWFCLMNFVVQHNTLCNKIASIDYF